MKSSKTTNWTTVRVKTSIVIIITAAVLMQMISSIQYFYFRNEISEDLKRNAEMELIIKTMDLRFSLNDVGLALRNRSWEFEQYLPYPDSLFCVTQRIVEQNPTFGGCCIAMIPDYYPEKGRLFEPNTNRRGSTIETVQLGSDEHDYTKNEVFVTSVEKDTSFWSEPYIYIDDDDSEITLITYTFPIHDASGCVVGVVGIDIITQWIGKLLNNSHMFPSSYYFLISGKGQLICGPEDNDIHKKALATVDLINDTTVPRSIFPSGFTTMIPFTDKDDGQKGYVFYHESKSLKPWKIGVVNYHNEVFAPLLKLRLRNFLLTLTGLLILGFIIHLAAKSFLNLQRAKIKSERIENELDIAKKIQMSMVPKPEALASRADLNICGLLDPAKEVGGDLYYYFVRDEKLYFCLGDVSGKGIPAALVMAVAHSTFQNVAAHTSNPADIMQILNETGCRDNDTNMFATFFIGVLDMPTGKLRYCNAGHDRPLVIGKEIRPLPVKANLPLGVMDSFAYVAQEEKIAPGETLFLFTDGLTEAKNKEHEQFTLNRVMATLSHSTESPEQIVNDMKAEVTTFVNGAEQSDDLTMLAIRYTPEVEKLLFGKTLIIENDVAKVSELNQFVKSVTDDLPFESKIASQIKLALEEAVVNIMEYAYPVGSKGQVTVEAEATETRLRFILTDEGIPFDPTEVSLANTKLSVEDRPIGGLGILLVRDLMDSINYEREGGKNILRLEKKYSLNTKSF